MSHHGKPSSQTSIGLIQHSPDKRQEIEKILIAFHDIFARHRFDIGINSEFKVKLPPNDDRPAHSQRLSTPINLKADITVELALLHKYGNITTLPFSKYASPIFAQRKPNLCLRLLVDPRKSTISSLKIMSITTTR